MSEQSASPTAVSGYPAAEDELALRAVAARYAAGVDQRDLDLFLSALHPDARLRVHQPSEADAGVDLAGHEQLAPVIDMVKAYARTFHFLGNTRYQVAGDTATGEVYCLAHHLTADPQGATDQVMTIRYQDTYTRRGGEWRISDRRVLVDWTETRAADVAAAA